MEDKTEYIILLKEISKATRQIEELMIGCERCWHLLREVQMEAGEIYISNGENQESET